MKCSFHGAARSVTGSRHLLEVPGFRVLLDCGLFQGRREEAVRQNRDLGFDPKSLGGVVLSHAQEPTDTNDKSRHLTGLIQQNFVDVADLLILLVVDIQASELRGAPLSRMLHGSGALHLGRRRLGWSGSRLGVLRVG